MSASSDVSNIFQVDGNISISESENYEQSQSNDHPYGCQIPVILSYREDTVMNTGCPKIVQKVKSCKKKQ